MAKISFNLDASRPARSGECTIYIRIYHRSQNSTITTGVRILPKFWDGRVDAPVRSACPNSRQINRVLSNMYIALRQRLAELAEQMDLRTISVARLRDLLLQREGSGDTSFSEMAGQVLEQRSNMKTRQMFKYTASAVEAFAGPGLMLSAITPKWLRRFNSHLEDSGCGASTRSIHLRNIRTIFNAAIDDGRAAADKYPFRGFRIPQSRKSVEALSVEDFRTIRDLKIEGPAMSVARDLFLLSFYMCGMNRVDLFNLGPLEAGRAVFVRQKTASKNDGTVSIAVQPEAAAIFERYAGHDHALRFIETLRDYEAFNNMMTHAISRIRKATGIRHLKFYAARYTWATMADAIGVNEKEIRKGLGHVDTSMAGRHYIAYDWTKVDAANRRVIDFANADLL